MPYKNNEELVAYRKRIKKERRWWLDVYKLSHGCQKCGGEFEVYELDIHHIDPNSKTIKPAHMPNSRWSIRAMLNELRGCKVLCKSCHREEHRRPTFGTSQVYLD